MMDFLKGWILNVVVLSVFIVMLEILVPSGKMKKFINLITGFILLIALLRPFINLLGKDAEFTEFQITGSNFIDKMELEEDKKILEDKQMEQTIKIYKQKLKSNIEETLKGINGISKPDAEVIIDEDLNSATFGEVMQVHITLNKAEKDDGARPAVNIDKIQVGSSKAVDKTSDKVDEKVMDEIAARMNRTLNIERDALVVVMADE